MDKNDTPTGLSPSASSPKEKRQKVQIGRGAVMLICGVALAAFAIYIFIVIYGLMSAA